MSTPSTAYSSVTPMLAVRNAADAMDWYACAFGAVEIGRLTTPDGAIAHGEFRIRNARIMIAEEHSDYNRSPLALSGSTVVLNIDVDDVDSAFERAVAAGAAVVIPLADQFYGDRAGRIMDPFGHLWILSKHIKDVSIEEMQQILDAAGK